MVLILWNINFEIDL